MPSLSQFAALLREPGAGWLLYRAGYAWRRRSGWLKRVTPRCVWADLPAPTLRLRPRAGETLPGGQEAGREAIAEAGEIIAGRFRLFSHRQVDAGIEPDWWRNALTGTSRGKPGHWSESGDDAGADIKGIWELSRFPWAFALARAHAWTGDVRFAAAFWRLWDGWLARNPPNEGPNWMCGQEATFRLMAVIFAAEACGVPAPQETPLARFVVATGRRIAGNLGYALSQKNNHGVSECIGLITAALCVPAHGEAAGWLERGTASLRAQLAELVYADGSFAQHSLIYHRVLLHDLAWCAARLQAAGRPVPDWLRSAAERALDFLMGLVDPRSGGAPLFGSNDGANVLPLADAKFLDLRPTVQLAAAVFRGELPLPPGPWDEAAAWLVGSVARLRRVDWPVVPAVHHAAEGGYLTLANGSDRLFLRCPTRFRHRPSQADMLHVDIWQDGAEVACDGGTFSYNSAERFVRLAEAAQHNVLTVDGVEPVRKFSRFLYLPWPRGSVSIRSGEGAAARHDAYARLGVDWTRHVARRAGGGFVIRDRVTAPAGRRLRWHWRLAGEDWTVRGPTAVRPGAPGKFQLRWSGADASARLLVADPDTAWGWRSEHYGAVRPASSLLLEVAAAGETEFVFEFVPAV